MGRERGMDRGSPSTDGRRRLGNVRTQSLGSEAGEAFEVIARTLTKQAITVDNVCGGADASVTWSVLLRRHQSAK